MATPLNIIFFGTSDFAQIILNQLISQKTYNLITVITQPDKKVGRKKIITAPPVKTLAIQHNIPILQPAKLNQVIKDKLQLLNTDIYIVVAYGKIIPQYILEIPQYKTINIHPSLLPKYRGPSPIQYALLNNESITGTTIMLIDKELDHGPLIAQTQININAQDTYTTLSKKLAKLSADLLIKTIPNYINKTIKPIKQDHNNATFSKIINKIDGQISIKDTAKKIINMQRAYTPWPGIFIKTQLNNKPIIIKLIKIEPSDIANKKNNPLELFTNNKNLYLTCADNTILKINELQIQGKNIIDASSFINGYMK